MSTTAFGDNSMEIAQMFRGFLDSNVSKRQLEAVDVPVVLPKVAQCTVWLKFANPKRTPTTHHFGDR